MVCNLFTKREALNFSKQFGKARFKKTYCSAYIGSTWSKIYYGTACAKLGRIYVMISLVFNLFRKRRASKLHETLFGNSGDDTKIHCSTQIHQADVVRNTVLLNMYNV